jgi:esterase/lipase superfamily enzyme/tetratricopeptide (TPR) repeat protein
MARQWMRRGVALIALAVLLATAPQMLARAQSDDDLAAMQEQVRQLHSQSRYVEAVPIAERYVALARQREGEEHAKFATAIGWLGILYETQGRYAEAEPLFKRALAINEKALGPDHPGVGTSLNNLAELYYSQGRYAEAEPLNKRALAVSEKALGPDHPDVGTSLGSLAGLYRAQGRYAEAEPLYKRSLALREKALGFDHPDVGESLNNLAGLYGSQGRYAEAEPLNKRALAISEKALGPDHPDVSISLGNLAGLYLSQGRYAEAEPLNKRALAISEKALGPDHPDVGTTLNNLAEVYRLQGRFSDAEPLYKRALAIDEKVLGSEHPKLGFDLTRLALLYQETGRNADADALIKRAVSIRQKALGDKHPDLGTSLSVLAGIQEKQDQRRDAENLYRRALGIQENTLGPDHPDVATTRGNLGALLKSDGRYDEARPLLESALTIREKTLPADHPAIAASLIQLAELYRLQGRTDDAQKLFKRALGLRKAGIQEVPVFFGTDRKLDTQAQSITFGNDRATGGQITFGLAKVTVLKERSTAGSRPATRHRKDVEESTDVARLPLQPLEILENSVLVERAHQLLQRAQLFKGTAMLFVHGYNVSFENAVRRAGQIAYDLNYDGPVFAFSWPSRGRLLGYVSDRDAVDVAAGHLKQFLDKVVARTNPTKINIIAHSMGNLVVIKALEKVTGDTAAPRLPLGEIINAAPDVDPDLFADFVVQTKEKGANVTLYASASDWALWFSGMLSRPRAGYAGGVLVPVKGADTIDITSVGTSLFSLNHDVYASSPLIVGDMRGIFQGDRPPDKRTKEFRLLIAKQGGTYWKYQPQIGPP